MDRHNAATGSIEHDHMVLMSDLVKAICGLFIMKRVTFLHLIQSLRLSSCGCGEAKGVYKHPNLSDMKNVNVMKHFSINAPVGITCQKLAEHFGIHCMCGRNLTPAMTPFSLLLINTCLSSGHVSAPFKCCCAAL